MPDLKFKDLKSYFSILNDSDSKHPLLLPRITNPNFLDSNFKIIGPPGIVEIIEGNLGLTEFAMKPIIEPILTSLDNMPELSAAIVNSNPNTTKSSFLTKEEVIINAKNIFLEKYIPKDVGMKPIEKTLISSMFESYKPFVDFLKLLVELLAVGEDVFCMFLGTSISILGKNIGIPSKNPKYWNKELNYAQTLNYGLEEFTKTIDLMITESEKRMSDKHILKNNIPNGNESNTKPTSSIDIPALYIGYFDEDGNSIDPPAWIKNSGKWLSRTSNDINGNIITVGSPLEQLSTDINIGVRELRERHQIQIEKLQRDKEKMLKDIDKRAKDIEKQNMSDERKIVELQSLNDERKESNTLFQELSDTLEDILDGTNKTKNNYVNDDNISDGINMPIVLNEWSGKVRGSQFRQKYFPELVSTSQTIVDKKGKPKEPYVYLPSKNIKYNGKNYKVEVPLAFPSQIIEKKVNSESTFYDKKLKKDGRTYSNQNEISNMDIFFGTDKNKPYIEKPETHFGNEIENLYIPDIIKNYYMPLEWEEILEYEIRSRNTGEVLRTEREVIPFKIDIENDYELRIIQVVNLPLIPPPNSSRSINYYPDKEDSFIMLFKNSIKFLKVEVARKKQSTKLTNSNGDDINNTTGSKYFRISRYIDEKYFKPNRFFLLRKSNSKFGDDQKNTDKDDGSIFKIKSIIGIKRNKKFDLIGEKDKNTELLTIDNTQKYIIDHNNKMKNELPVYITLYKKNNFKFLSGTIYNNNKEIRITKIIKDIDKTIYYYTGNLTSEIISASYDTTNSKEVINTISYEWIDKTIVNTIQQFKNDSTFNGDYYFIDDINYIPDELKNPPNSFFVLGFENTSILSTLNKKKTRENISKLLNKKTNTETDGLYTVTNITTETLDNGLVINSLKLNIDIPKQFRNLTISSDTKSNFYYPLRIVGYTTNPSNGSSKFIQDQLSETGTLYTDNNNIPNNYDPQKPNQAHSTPDIKENNNLKEGIIFHGLDPRYVSRDKYKHFWLVEAIKKDTDGLAKINGKTNPNDASLIQNTEGDKGKEWYGLMDRFTAPTMIITKLVPIIVSKLIPLVVKIFQIVSNPTKIKELILDIVIKNEDISKLPQNFIAFSQKGLFGKFDKLNEEGVNQDFDSYQNKKVAASESENGQFNDSKEFDPFVYNGPQVGVENPSIITMLDGQALVDFGLKAFGKAIISFGVDITGNKIEDISELVPITDFKNPPVKKTQSLLNFILQIIKLPFETLFMIFKWIIDWVKKLLNPVKIPGAVKELLTFEWLKNILGCDGLLGILGIPCIEEKNVRLQSGINDLKNNIFGDNAKFLVDQTREALRGQNFEFIEVLIYNVLINGTVVATEQEERPYTGTNIDSDIVISNFESESESESDRNLENENENENLFFCGPRFFNIKDIAPIPFLAPMPNYNACELPIIYLKPLELIVGLFKFIQNIINGFLTIPSAILGLDPLVPLPKFGEGELIPFADIFEKILQELKKN